jgi:hypothetical protein
MARISVLQPGTNRILFEARSFVYILCELRVNGIGDYVFVSFVIFLSIVLGICSRIL